MGRDWDCSTHVRRNSYKILVGRQGKRPLGRRRHRWKYNIRIDLREIIGREGVYWRHLAQDKDQW